MSEWYPDAQYDERGLVSGSTKSGDDVTDRVCLLFYFYAWTSLMSGANAHEIWQMESGVRTIAVAPKGRQSRHHLLGS